MSSSLPERRTIEELAARYTLEPTLRDIYVEGRTDLMILSWLAETWGWRDIKIYEISTVNIPESEVTRHSLTYGRKGQVVALAYGLCTLLPLTHRQVACIADRDTDTILGKTFECRYLAFTDYADFEMYLFNEYTIGKFLRLVGHIDPISQNGIHNALAPALIDLFLVRAVNDELRLELDRVSFERSCTVRNGGVAIDMEDYINRTLQKNQNFSMKTTIVAKITELRAKLSQEPRHFMNGHDYVEMMHLYLRRELKLTSLGTRDVLGGILRSTLEPQRLARTQLITRLAEMLGQTTSAQVHGEM